MKTVVMMIVVLPLLAGCASKPHPWLKRPAQFNPEAWQAIPEDHIRTFNPHADRAAFSHAMELLADQEAVALKPEQAAEFWNAGNIHADGDSLPPADATRAYLVRSVTHGRAAWYAAWRNTEDGSIWVHQATYDREVTYAAWTTTSAQSAATVVYLASPPTAVYATAALMGEGIFAGPPAKPPGKVAR